MGKRGASPVGILAPPPKKTKYEDFGNIFESLEDLVANPENFATESKDLAQQILLVLQGIYQYGKTTEPKKLSSLNKLVVDRMDSDQIWEQLQLFNKPLLKYINSLPFEEHLNQTLSNSGSEEDEEEMVGEDSTQRKYTNASDSEDSSMDELEIKKHQGDGDDDTSSDEDEENVDQDMDQAHQEDSDSEKSHDEDEKLEDDPFFDLDEMEAFIQDGERRAEQGSEGEDEELLEYLNQSDLSDSDSESDGGIDWDKMKKGAEGEKSKAEIRYDDFFKEPEKLSKYQKRKQKMKERIESLEETNIADKPWQLQGEVSGKHRPKDSLLEEYVIFDHATKTAPVITIEKAQELEDVIKQRIMEESWDDVLPKKVLADERKPKEQKELDHEKSKHGLAEVYEREYLGLDREEAERKANEKYEEITELFNSLCHKLDVLSNFHYTPQRAKKKAEDEEKKNVPAIEMEEVLPTTVSDASLLAPEEVYAAKKKPMKGETEMTSEEKKTRRRAAKAAIRKQKKAEEADRKLVEKINPGLGNKYTKQAAIDNLKQLRKSKNVQFAPNKPASDQINYTQSTAFFSKLQQDAQTEISKFKESKKKKETTSKSSANNYKL